MSKIPFKQDTLHQLSFPLHLHENYTFSNFYVGPNEVVVASLKYLIQERDFTHSIYLWGHPLVGCTHLLQACCETAQQRGLKATYLSLKEVMQHHSPFELPELLQGEIICLDDVQAIGSNSEWEEALFSIYNQFLTKQIPIIFAAHQVPHQLQLRLPDLVSRLNSGLLFQVHALNDSQKMSALQLRARLRGLELPDAVAKFLIYRLPRSPRTLLEVLNQLDVFSLAKKRKLTLPFVKEVLKI